MCTHNPESILIVDDEPAVRGYVEAVLRRHGFRTASAPNGPEALAQLDHLPQVHLLLTDVGMPFLNGVDFASEFVLRRPATPVVFMSGHVDEGLRSRIDGAILSKPFKPVELLAAIGAVLGFANARAGKQCPFYGFHWPCGVQRLSAGAAGACGLDLVLNGPCVYEQAGHRVDYRACPVGVRWAHLVKACDESVTFDVPGALHPWSLEDWTAITMNPPAAARVGASGTAR